MTERKVKGAIFKAYTKEEPYFLRYGYGGTNHKADAHVFTQQEVNGIRNTYPDWASKKDGKWLLVYE